MKITRVDTYTVRVPNHPISWSSPEYGPDVWDEPTIVIAKVHTDEGIVGLGEITRGVPEVTARPYLEQLVGLDPMTINLQYLPIGDSWDRAPGVYDGVEAAIFDIIGKARGVPIHQLLGGAFRSRVSVSLCSGEMNPTDAARLARKGVDRGYQFLKLKAHGNAPVVERIAAINQAVGAEIKVVIDGNGRLGLPVDLDAICLRLEPFRHIVQCFEDPWDRRRLGWYRMTRTKLHFPLALHLGPGADVIEAIKAEACDYMNLGGSMVNFVRTAATAHMADIPCWHGSGVGLGISEAAIVHACAAAEGCVLSSDVVGENIRTDDLIRFPLEIRDGHVMVPQEPGLGVELDEVALERYGVKSASTVG